MEHLALCLLTQYRFSVVDCEFTLQVWSWCHKVFNSLYYGLLTVNSLDSDSYVNIS